MKYTIILRRSSYLMDLFDNEDEHYVANGDTEFANIKDACRAAKIEAAKADIPDIKDAMRERGMSVRGLDNDPDNYEVLFAFEGQHSPVFGWQPELCQINENWGG